MPEFDFVYPNHPNFQPFLELAKCTEMIVTDNGYVHYQHVDVPYALTGYYAAFGHIDPDVHDSVTAQRIRARRQDQQFITQDFWYSNGGLSTLSYHKIWPIGFVNEGYRVSDNYHGGDRSMATEIITYGVGVLRPKKPEHQGMAAFFAETARRVDSRRRKSLATYIVDMHHYDGNDWGTRPYALDSTNLVMPETLGELRQLCERRDERSFLESYLRNMQIEVEPKPVPVYSFPQSDEPTDPLPAPESMRHSKWRWREAQRAHIQSGPWGEPPTDTAELIDRVDTLLGQIAIDDNPTEQTHQDEPSPELLQLIDKFSGRS